MSFQEKQTKYFLSNVVIHCADNTKEFCDKTGNPEALRRRKDFCTSVSIVTWKQYVQHAAISYSAVNILRLILCLKFQVNFKLQNDGGHCMLNSPYSHKSETVTEIRHKSQANKPRKHCHLQTCY